MKTQQRWRITFGKGNQIKYISHLDLHVTWERAFRRAMIPLSYSQGFNPQPKIQLAAALPVGYTSCAEVMDIFVDAAISANALQTQLEPVLPPGLWVIATNEVDLKAPSLQASLIQAEYLVHLQETDLVFAEIRGRVAAFLNASSWEQRRQRRGKVETINLRPLVLSLEVDEERQTAGQMTLGMRVAAGQGANVRPDTVLEALLISPGGQPIQRTKLVFQFDSN